MRPKEKKKRGWEEGWQFLRNKILLDCDTNI